MKILFEVGRILSDRFEVIIKDTGRAIGQTREDVETLDQTRIDLGNVIHVPVVIARMLIVNQHKGDVTLKTKEGPHCLRGDGARLYNHGPVISASVNYNCIS